MYYHHAEKQFLVRWCFNELTRRITFNKDDTVLNPLNKNLLVHPSKLHQSITWVLCMDPAVMFSDTSLVKYFPQS